MRELFEHYGFRPDAVEAACSIARKYTFERMTSSKSGPSHLRSGKSGEWRSHFTDAHRQAFKEMYPAVLVRLGYEKDVDW